MTLVRIAKECDWPDILRQTPGGEGAWDGIHFTTDDVEECDVLVVLNTRMKHDIHVRCPRGRVWALMQEAYVWGFAEWMVEQHDAFDRVYSNYIPSSDLKYTASQPALPWFVNRTFDELTTCPMPEKNRPLSWIIGNCRDLPGHLKRYAFLREIQSAQGLDIDLFGRAVRPIEDKWDGLAQYRYSIAAENTSSTDYWTEKIVDCFLAWTVPFYYGCENLEKYFPSDSFIRIDINCPQEAIEIIQRTLREDNWARRLPALEEARRRVLYEYQIFPFLAKIIKAEQLGDFPKFDHLVPAYRRSIRASIRRILYKARRRYLSLGI